MASEQNYTLVINAHIFPWFALLNTKFHYLHSQQLSSAILISWRRYSQLQSGNSSQPKDAAYKWRCVTTEMRMQGTMTDRSKRRRRRRGRRQREREWEQARNARGMKLEKVLLVLLFLLLLEVVNGMMVCCIQVWLVFVQWVITRRLSSSRYWKRLGLFRRRFVWDPARR